MNKTIITGIIIGILSTLVIGLGYDLYKLNVGIVFDNEVSAWTYSHAINPPQQASSPVSVNSSSK